MSEREQSGFETDRNPLYIENISLKRKIEQLKKAH